MFPTKFEFLKTLKIKIIKMSRTAIVNFEMVYKTEFTWHEATPKQTVLLYLMKS